MANKKSDEVVQLLKDAGAVPPPEIDIETLHSYTGRYKGELGPEVEITIQDGRLFAAPGAQQLLGLWPLDQTTFKPIAFDNAMVIFNVEDDKPVGLTFVQDGCSNELRRL